MCTRQQHTALQLIETPLIKLIRVQSRADVCHAADLILIAKRRLLSPRRAAKRPTRLFTIRVILQLVAVYKHELTSKLY